MVMEFSRDLIGTGQWFHTCWSNHSQQDPSMATVVTMAIREATELYSIESYVDKMKSCFVVQASGRTPNTQVT